MSCAAVCVFPQDADPYIQKSVFEFAVDAGFVFKDVRAHLVSFWTQSE